MPTGYTAVLYEGKDQSFSDFVLHCARAIDFCIGQRDDSSNAFPALQEPTAYHVERLVEANDELERLKAMSDEEADVEARTEREQRLSDRENHDREALVLLERYQNMLTQVKAWQPPTPDHAGLKKFMIEQLESSIKFDCSTGGWPQIPPFMSGQEWRQHQIEQLLYDIDYHTRENLKEIERIDRANRWIESLYGSIGVSLS